MKKGKDIWFPAKKFGWGWGLPKVWQGWVVLVTCLAVAMSPMVYFSGYYKGDTYCQELMQKDIKVTCNPDGTKGMYVAASLMWMTGWLLILTIICSKKGEMPQWQWHLKHKK